MCVEAQVIGRKKFGARNVDGSSRFRIVSQRMIADRRPKMEDRTGLLSPVFGLYRKPETGTHASLGESIAWGEQGSCEEKGS